MRNAAITAAIAAILASMALQPASTGRAQPPSPAPAPAPTKPAQAEAFGNWAKTGTHKASGHIETDEHRVFKLEPAVEIPEGAESIKPGGEWIFDPAIHHEAAGPTTRYATGQPSQYVDGVPVPYTVTFKADVAQVGYVDAELADGTKVRKKVFFLPVVTVQQTWTITVIPRGPPPKPEEPEAPTPEGPRSTAIIYDPLAGRPIAGEAATIALRNQGERVFFVSAETTTGTGTTPGFLASAIQEAKRVGLPALVLMTGSEVTSAEPMPATKDAIVAKATAATN